MTNTLFDALFAPHVGNSATFLHCDDGATLTYDAFLKRAAQLAHTLTDAGVHPGDRILVQAPKLSDTIALYAASVQAGAVYLPLNTAYTQAELDYFIQDADPRLIVCDSKDEATVKALAQPRGTAVLTLGGSDGSLSRTADGKPTSFTPVDRAPDDLAALLYTSGTTGRSKGAMLSHKNLLSNAVSLTELWEITCNDRLVHALPIFHTHGLFVAMNTSLLAGAEVRLCAAFDIDVILNEVPRSTLLMGVPTFYTRLLADARFTKDCVQNMRLFVSGSAPLLAETHRDFEDRTGHRILERYGMTETNMITSNPLNGARLAGTVGYPLAGTEVKITNPDTGATQPFGEIGMIEVRGDNVFQGYWNMPEKTAEELRATGFFLTGDLGIQSEDGRVSIVGRSKDLIISGGYNIYPKEIEDVLNDMPDVNESAVFGIPNPDFGESVIAAIVPEQGATLSIEAMKDRVQTQLARFKHPREYLLLETLPRNTMGKVQKNVLRDTYGS
ncbi:Long-chain-fatty-acid--CoA ligase [Shimia sp. SK013]|uniref:malonate--CoA ligase n=1 Tax=Shimia sp. SK013 TaxID=1389006 RepID=UPI0006B5F936|nr:malonyl-CoA synthase [Shimia sp. SK013]KPA22252.1 Long-chain-fatty-acid--CoA ligase [Shimia sp. SK013]